MRLELLGLVVVTSCVARAHVDEPPPPPNIVLILSDDMGFSDIGCYGGEIRTPNLDRLAAGGVRFSQFYNGARCCPTRASLLTGLYAHQAGMGWMEADHGLPGYTGQLNDRCVTLAEVLGEAGYRTYLSGKWHVTLHRGREGPKDQWPLQRGFERFYGTIIGAGSFYDPTTLCRGNEYITPNNDPDYQPETFYYTDAITDNAVTFLEQHREQSPDQPFFLYASYTAAHWPMHALPEDIDRYEGIYDAGYDATRAKRMQRLVELGLVDPAWNISPAAKKWSEVENRRWEIRCMEVYAAMVDRMDQGIGRILEEIRRQGQWENTLVVFLQDNGGCAETMGRGPPKNPYPTDLVAMTPDELQTKIWPPMQTRDGRPVRVGPEVLAGAEDTYIAYGKGWANVSNTPFREYKHWVHEGGIATPLIAHWPDGIPAEQADSIESQPGHLIDLMATFVDVSGAVYPNRRGGQLIHPMEGASLVPALRGAPIQRDAPLFWEHEGNRAVRDGDFKLVAKGKDGPWELYDLSSDRTELTDLAAQRPEVVQQLSEAWQQWAERAHVLPMCPWH